MRHTALFEFDVAIVGAGPAGLSAAITLGRARRRVAIFDHAKPRNFAARAVHCFLGLDGLSPAEIRKRGRDEATRYGAIFFDAKVTAARCVATTGRRVPAFAVTTVHGETHVRSLLLATGMMDHLPEISGVKEAYGQIVHHCPYCDGFEHRDQSLIALGNGESGPQLGAELLAWSSHVTVCTNGHEIPEHEVGKLQRLRIPYRPETISRLDKEQQLLYFADGTSTACDAMFFSSGQSQRSDLSKMLGCECDDEGLIVTQKRHRTNVKGLYSAGDVDGDVQLSIVAAAEGAAAAMAIHHELLEQEQAT